jgi:predicted Co/Zn/Cd cation transporter (cation efflux family)
MRTGLLGPRMDRSDRSPMVTLLTVLVLLAVALFLGGIARGVATFFVDLQRTANGIGGLVAVVAFLVFLVGYVLARADPRR